MDSNTNSKKIFGIIILSVLIAILLTVFFQYTAVNYFTVLFPSNKVAVDFAKRTFKSNAFDLDLITILFKYRPLVHEFPNQLNTNFNGALYAGYRTDSYTLSYKNTPLHISKRKVVHFGYSVGGFAGAGSPRIDEHVTLNRIDYEYDGPVLIKRKNDIFRKLKEG